MYKVYQVTTNESLDDIARKFNTTKEELIRLNGNIGNLFGSFIIVPNNSEYKTYTVKQGDSMYAIAKNNSIDYDTLLKINGLDSEDYIYPNQQILIPNEKIYVTKANETISDVVTKLGVNMNDISNLKDLKLMEEQIIIIQ